MKKHLTKYDFLAINRRMNQNFNGGQSYGGINQLKITKGKELKLNRKESEAKGKRK
ncbi:MAG: hypothetical protein IKY42_10860 [Bacteroidaceae bacterium]|nr:hypothetical protein [Bacteroidaceae bacterium]